MSGEAGGGSSSDFRDEITFKLVEIPSSLPETEEIVEPLSTRNPRNGKSESGSHTTTTTTTIFALRNQQVEQQENSRDNGISESTQAQLTSSQNMSGQSVTPPTPGTPTSSELGPDVSSHGSGGGGGVNCPSPNYITITNASNNGGDGLISGVNNMSYTSLTPIKSTNGGDDGIRGNGNYVTYVETSGEHPLYGNNANSTSDDDNVFPVYTVGESYQNSGGRGQYYSAAVAHSDIPFTQQHDGSGETTSYLTPSGNNNSTDAPNANLVGQPVSHTTRVSPATVQWLLDNYETAEGVSLPRSTLYYHYIKHTQDHNLDPVNAASFGKLIRSVFLGLRTRRLGTRGNSKYHYYGIRLKPTSPLNGLDEKAIDDIMASRYGPHRHPTTNGVPVSGNNFSEISSNQSRGHAVGSNCNKRQRLTRPNEQPQEIINPLPVAASDAPNIQRYLGDSSHVISNLPELDINAPLPDGLVPHDLGIFHSLYRELCTQLLGDMINFQFSDFQRRWRIFFRTEKSASWTEEQQHYENILPKSKLHALCALPHVQDYVRRTDYQLYQNLAVILLPDVLRPIPSVMTQTIRNFAKVVENCMAVAMSGFPEEMIAVKLSVLSAFGQTLRRHTSLNHLAQAARAVLQNEVQIHQMLSDLNRVDFSNVEEQASWVCGCNSDIVPDLEADFKGALAQHQSLEEWAVWLESVVDRILRPHENTSRYTAVARYFLLKWSFYSSLVIRDLTLRSAASFGSFHLLRLLYDEYMFYLIENRVARAINTLPIAVLGKKLLNPLHLDTTSTDDDSESYETMSTHKDCQFQSYSNSENDLQCLHDSPRSTSSGGNGVPLASGNLIPSQVSPEPHLHLLPQGEAEAGTGVMKRGFKQRAKSSIV